MDQDHPYQRAVLAQLMDPSKWPSFESPDFSDRLERMAERAIARRTFDANLAAILIYHQLGEELLRVLLADCRFFIRCSLLPAKIDFAAPKKQTFGQIEAEVRSSVEFHGKDRLLAVVGELNTLRIGIVHKLTKRGSIAGVRKEALKSQRLYRRAFLIFDSAHEFFRVVFNDLRKDRVE